jgi:PAS domain-containing protein
MTQIADNYYLKTLIDSLPSALFIVGKYFKIYDANPEAKEMFKIDAEEIVHRLCGEILNCQHAIEEEVGCGNTEYFEECVIRRSVEISGKGVSVYKRNMNLSILVLEDITGMYHLKRLLPICASCKKIRNDDNYWEKVADYLKNNSHLGFYLS